MDYEARILVDLLKIATGLISPQKDRFLDTAGCDWNKVLGYAQAHQVHPLVHVALKHVSHLPPSDIRTYFYDAYRSAQLSCARAWHEFMRISAAFEKEDVPLVPLKGLAFLDDIYVNLSARAMADMDLLVKPEDFPRVESVLHDLGYAKDLEGLHERYWKEKNYHIKFVRHCSGGPSFFVEVHWLLDFPHRWSASGGRLWERMRVLNAHSRDVAVLSPEDSILSLALHQRRYGNPLGLKNILDAALLLKKYSSMDWDYIAHETHRVKARAAMHFLLLQAKMLFKVEISEQTGKNFRVSCGRHLVMRHIIDTETFLSVSIPGLKKGYAKFHFLLHDSIVEAILYLFRIPQEHFAQYYNLPQYDSRTGHYYRYRWWYMILWLVIRDFLGYHGGKSERK